MKLHLCLILLLIPFTASSALGMTQSKIKPSVIVSIAPQAYFAKQIAGDLIDISVLVQPSDSPATYEPSPKQMTTISKASLYFTIGVPFEKTWLKKISALNKNIIIVNTDNGIEKIEMQDHNCHESSKLKSYNSKKCSHGIKDPHVWTSPPLVKIIITNMANTLIKIDPKNKKTYQDNLQKFEKKINSLHDEITSLFKGKEKIEFIVFHPSWGYFATTYGLTQTPAEIEGKEPKPAQLAKLITHAREKGLKTIFVQPQFSKKSANIIATAINGRVISADPLAYDWTNNIRNQAIQIAESIK